MTPKILFPNLVKFPWEQILFNSNEPLIAYCNCELAALASYSVNISDLDLTRNWIKSRTRIDLVPNRVTNNKKEEVSIIWAGQCLNGNCNKIYWACNNFDWFSQMSPLEKLVAVLIDSNSPISIKKYDNFIDLISDIGLIIRFEANLSFKRIN